MLGLSYLANQGGVASPDQQDQSTTLAAARICFEWGGTLAGIEWSSAVDGTRVFAAVTNAGFAFYLLQPKEQQQVNGGSWAALDAATRKFDWQTAVPGVNPATGKPGGGLGAVTVANGVLYAGSLSGEMDAIDAASGAILWRFESGGSLASGHRW